MEVNKEELRRLAEATGGIRWVASHATSHQGSRSSRSIYHYPTPYQCVEIVETPDSDPENGECIHDESSWAYIAAANPAAILALLDEIGELRGLLASRVIESTALVNFAANRGGLTVGYEGGGCALLAETLGRQLYESQAVNYIEATFESRLHPELGEIVVTLKREVGKTPHQLRMAAEAERDQLRAENERLRAQLAESQANDRTAMGYLAEMRAAVGGDDFPAMVRSVQALRKDAERWSAAYENDVDLGVNGEEFVDWLVEKSRAPADI